MPQRYSIVLRIQNYLVLIATMCLILIRSSINLHINPNIQVKWNNLIFKQSCIVDQVRCQIIQSSCRRDSSNQLSNESALPHTTHSTQKNTWSSWMSWLQLTWWGIFFWVGGSTTYMRKSLEPYSCISNGVDPGWCLLPTGVCVYRNRLIIQIRQSNIGCQ